VLFGSPSVFSSWGGLRATRPSNLDADMATNTTVLGVLFGSGVGAQNGSDVGARHGSGVRGADLWLFVWEPLGASTVGGT
jgi:outer membrane lipoprotein SlyB